MCTCMQPQAAQASWRTYWLLGVAKLGGSAAPPSLSAPRAAASSSAPADTGGARLLASSCRAPIRLCST